MPPENEQAILAANEVGDDELEQWLTSVGDGADIQLPGLDIGIPPSSRREVLNNNIDQSVITNDGGTGEDEDEIDDDAGDDTDPTGAPQNAPAPASANAPADFTLSNGQTISREDAERLYNFDQYLRANPDKAAAVNAAIAGQPTPAQPAVPEAAAQASTWEEPEVPDFLDLDDPAQKFQWDTHVQTQKVLFEQEQRSQKFFQQQAETTRQSQVRQAETDMAAALVQFKTTHPNLNEDDIVAIRKAAGPFVQGMLAQLPPVEGLIRSMEVGGMMDEGLRTKLTDPTVRTRSEAQQTRHRKRISGAISGSPRSAPKGETTRPTNQMSDKDFLNELAQGFNEAMQR